VRPASIQSEFNGDFADFSFPPRLRSSIIRDQPRKGRKSPSSGNLSNAVRSGLTNDLPKFHEKTTPLDPVSKRKTISKRSLIVPFVDGSLMSIGAKRFKNQSGHRQLHAAGSGSFREEHDRDARWSPSGLPNKTSRRLCPFSSHLFTLIVGLLDPSVVGSSV